VVIVGASSGVGRALAEESARAGHDLFLAARSTRDLAAIAADLAIRYHVRAFFEAIDLASPDIDVTGFAERSRERLGGVDVALLTSGAIHPLDKGPAEPTVITHLARVNFEGVVKAAAAFARILEQQGRGSIVLFSSIAAAAPRSQNTVYSAAKAGLEAYGKGLRHYFRDSGVVVQTYALGYVDTTMTLGKELRLPIVSPRRVAAYVLRNIHRNRGKVYFPRFWRMVTLVLQHTPWFLYRRLSF
jgi:short-subunit dehydrogenase